MRIIRGRGFKLILLLVSLVVVVTAPRTLYEMWQRRDILRQRQEVRDKIARENEKLRQELAEAQTPEYIEEVAREKLGLIKEGETVVLLPKSQISNPNYQTSSEENIANWKKWWRLFF